MPVSVTRTYTWRSSCVALDPNAPTGRRELHRVRQQVEEHLPNLLGIRTHDDVVAHRLT